MVPNSTLMITSHREVWQISGLHSFIPTHNAFNFDRQMAEFCFAPCILKIMYATPVRMIKSSITHTT